MNRHAWVYPRRKRPLPPRELPMYRRERSYPLWKDVVGVICVMGGALVLTWIVLAMFTPIERGM